MGDLNDLISVEELAGMLRVRPCTILRRVAKEIPFYQTTPRRRLFRASDVERWIQSKRSQVEGDPIVKKLLQQVTA